MIKSKAIRKIFITTVAMFVLLIVFSIPIVDSEKIFPVNMAVEDVSGEANDIYLTSGEHLVKANILLNEGSCDKNVLKILNSLKVNETSKYSNGLSGTIPNNVKIKGVFCGSDLVTIDFSKEFFDVLPDNEKQMISSIVYSVLDVSGISGVSILVEGVNLVEYPNSKENLPLVLDKNIGINTDYDINSREDISRVVVYYLDDVDEMLYYVPVTKYVNDDREKIKIIIEELTTSYIYEDNLMSFLNNKTKLLDYKEENDILFLNFNEFLFDNNDKVLEEVIYSIGYSVFDNYDVSMVMFQVNGDDVGFVSRK